MGGFLFFFLWFLTASVSRHVCHMLRRESHALSSVSCWLPKLLPLEEGVPVQRLIVVEVVVMDVVDVGWLCRYDHAQPERCEALL